MTQRYLQNLLLVRNQLFILAAFETVGLLETTPNWQSNEGLQIHQHRLHTSLMQGSSVSGLPPLPFHAIGRTPPPAFANQPQRVICSHLTCVGACQQCSDCLCRAGEQWLMLSQLDRPYKAKIGSGKYGLCVVTAY